MALAERQLAALFGDDIVDHSTYVLACDGGLMEGISQEAIALAGHLKLNKLIVLFDDNGISIDGPLALADSVDQVKRFEAAGWAATRIDGHDPAAIAAAIEAAKKADAAVADRLPHHHRLRRADQGRHREGPWRAARRRRDRGGARKDSAGARRLSRFRSLSASNGAPPARAAGRRGWPGKSASPRSFAKRAEFERRTRGELPKKKLAGAVRAVKEKLSAAPKEIATRAASELALEALTAALPEMVGGSADLTGSNNTRTKAMKVLSAADYSGRFIHYGVREHAMAAAMNGMALHGGIIPYSGTFLVFSDYCRPAIRLAALMGQRVIYVMTHDSIGLGEDGPTHQPVEHLAALRAIPNLKVFRPCDAVETAECWQLALESKNGPSVLALTRQNVPQLRQGFDERNRCALGAYELIGAEDDAAVVSLFASGSEVAIAVAAQKLLAERRVSARVVSVPCFELLLAAPEDKRAAVIGKAKVNVAIEAGIRQGWDAIIGSDGGFVGMTGFGASAPYKELYKQFGLTAEKVAQAALSKLS